MFGNNQGFVLYIILNYKLTHVRMSGGKKRMNLVGEE